MYGQASFGALQASEQLIYIFVFILCYSFILSAKDVMRDA